MTTIHLQGTIPDELSNARLDQALAKLFSQYSRAQLQQWVKSGQVSVDGRIVTRPRDKVFASQKILIAAELNAKEDWSAQEIPLTVVYADDAMIIINKPAGLVVHPGAGNPDQTLVNALLHYDSSLAELPRAGIIHRLDKETTGLLVVARTLAAHHSLTQAMSERAIERHYLALVQGVLISGSTIDAPIARHPTARTKMAVVANGRDAVTHYRVSERFRCHTLLDIKLETGRTHQIRVHMAYIHYPLVGDTVYAKTQVISSKLSMPLQTALKQFKRQALHACRLSVPHPVTHEMMTFEAPVPEDMAKLLELLREDAQ